MQALILVTGQSNLLSRFRTILQIRFSTATIAEYGNPGEFVVQFSGHHQLFVEYYGQNLADWDDDEVAFIKSALPTAQHVYSLGYRGIEFAKQAIISLANSVEMIVDNDCGTLLTGADFVRKVLAEPNWYWFDDL
ncbi:hypothetical protein [Hymenobacter cellulosilyticus]|uniref:Uncharacterized protein n=1 Tax=Hymenobacter cellulosilyticus TaxID=2932248 RepID=A0A8T9Q7P6_9BACT|nr:hypothetical protein [Hymenobacter cellulosilyticus]UOQ71043.1 hypothetical protein MUN79_20570 [Hymenobacter cellulosilyticus]